MKRLIYILAVVLLVVMASGCTSDQWASNKTYSGNGITFQYPGSWNENVTKNIVTPAGSSGFVVVGDDNEEFKIGTISVTGFDASSVQETLNAAVQQFQSQGYGSSKSVPVDGTTATMITSTSKDADGYYNSLAFWVKNNNLYYAAYLSNTNDTTTMTRILSSLKTT
jgi:hypothetical protein